MPLKRKLAAILVCDIVGYSRMMRDSETETYAQLKRFKSDVVAPELAKHNGRLVKYMGDGLLAVFDSAVHAVECALSIQQRMDGEGLRLRSGVNVGDVMFEDDDVHGDGVNVAARLEALCTPGVVCMSDTVYDQVRDRIGIEVEDLGSQKLKNMDRPVGVKLWTGGAIDTRRPDGPVGHLPEVDRPSIAVLAFVNMSRDPEQDFFAEGISEDITTALSRIERFAVASRTSSFSLKGQSLDVQQIGDRLGVRYVLEGSVRVAAERLRVTAQLIDARTGSHIWAEKYDRTRADLFDIQDEVTRNVVASIQTQIEVFEGSQIPGSKGMSLPVSKLVQLSAGCMYRMDEASLHEAVAYAEEALELDPQCGGAALALSNAVLHVAFMTHPENENELIERAVEMGERAVRLAPNDEYSYWVRGMAWMFTGKVQRAMSDFDRALEINPNCSLAWGCLGIAQALSGAPQDAIRSCNIAINSNPRDPTIFFRYADLSFVYLLLEDYEKAVAWARKSILNKPEYVLAHTVLIAALQALGQEDEARAAVSECARTCRHIMHDKPYVALLQSKEEAERVLSHLRSAGAV